MKKLLVLVSAFSIESWVSYVELKKTRMLQLNTVSAFSIESWVSYGIITQLNRPLRRFSILYRILGELLAIIVGSIASVVCFSILYRILGELQKSNNGAAWYLPCFSILYRILGELQCPRQRRCCCHECFSILYRILGELPSMRTSYTRTVKVSAFSIESWVSYSRNGIHTGGQPAVSAFSIESWVSYFLCSMCAYHLGSRFQHSLSNLG